MKTRGIDQAKARAFDSHAKARVIASALAGVLWGAGWGMCLETYQRNEGLSFLGFSLTPLPSFGVGIVIAGFALTTLAFVFHPQQTFWRPLLAALIAAFLAALLFYAVLVALASLIPNVRSATLEEFLLPLGWGIDNAALFLALRCTDAPRSARSTFKHDRRIKRVRIGRLLCLLPMIVLVLFIFASAYMHSVGVMLAVIPPIVWTLMALIGELEGVGDG